MTRTDLLNHLIAQYGYESYLEIGVQWSENYRRINCPLKHCVDPNKDYQATFVMTSDQFFAEHNYHYDLIFIDGLHLAEQVSRDIDNSLRALNPGGTIVCHDCNPTSEEMQQSTAPGSGIPWQGTVWQAIAQLRISRPDLEVFVIDTDFGLGVIRPGQQICHPQPQTLNYDYLDQHRVELLNLISVEAAQDRL